MVTKQTGHVWHMLLLAGAVGLAFWLGAGAGGALLFALLACTAMVVAVVWIAVWANRAGVTDPRSSDRQSDQPDDQIDIR